MTDAERAALQAQMAAWLAWARPAEPSPLREAPELARLRERWPLGGGGEGPRDMAALEREWRRGGGRDPTT